jgi:signal transduction histidine kinase
MTERATETAEGRLLATLQRLLELPAIDLSTALDEASQHIVDALGCDKVDAFLFNEEKHSLVAIGTSNTPMGRKQRALGLDFLPLANGGKIAESFVTGRTIVTGHLDQEAGELRGMVDALGVRSQIDVPLEVNGARRGVLSAVSATPEFFDKHDVIFMTSVSHWVGALAHRAELIEEIRTADVQRGRRAAADEIVTVLAHDLRNHLNPLQGRLQLLRMGAARDGRERDVEHVNAALRSVQRLTLLVSDLLDVGRLDHGLFALNPVSIDVVALTRETAAALGTPDVEIQVSAPDELLVMADPDRLKQALENVVGNAIRYSPKGDPVRVEIRGGLENGGRQMTLDVIDQGPGVPAEILPHVFERFAVGKGSSGLGLGLYLASRIVGVHGGSLTVESAPGKGTRFRFVLPIDGPTSPSDGG